MAMCLKKLIGKLRQSTTTNFQNVANPIPNSEFQARAVEGKTEPVAKSGARSLEAKYNRYPVMCSSDLLAYQIADFFHRKISVLKLQQKS